MITEKCFSFINISLMHLIYKYKSTYYFRVIINNSINKIKTYYLLLIKLVIILLLTNVSFEEKNQALSLKFNKIPNIL